MDTNGKHHNRQAPNRGDGEHANDSRRRSSSPLRSRNPNTPRNRLERRGDPDDYASAQRRSREYDFSGTRGTGCIDARAHGAHRHAARARTAGYGTPSYAKKNPMRQASHGNARASIATMPTHILIAGIIATVVFFLLIGMMLSRCSHSSVEPEVETNTPAPLYNWDNLASEDGRYAYYVDGRKVSRLGIDVSESQGEIDWEAVAADGIEFAIVRVGYRGSTEGEIYTDVNFDTNIDGAINAGIDVGVYFYSQAVDEEEAREEAQRCLYEINKRDLQYPVVFDFEETMQRTGRADQISSDQASANAKAFCQEIEKGGYKAMIYGNQYDLGDYNLDMISEYPIWYAEYGSTPSSYHEFSMWQYSNKGSVNGISTEVDMDIDLSNVPEANG